MATGTLARTSCGGSGRGRRIGRVASARGIWLSRRIRDQSQAYRSVFRRLAALVACILATTERAAAVTRVLHRTARSLAASASARACLAHARAMRDCLRSSADDIPMRADWHGSTSGDTMNVANNGQAMIPGPVHLSINCLQPRCGPLVTRTRGEALHAGRSRMPPTGPPVIGCIRLSLPVRGIEAYVGRAARAVPTAVASTAG